MIRRRRPGPRAGWDEVAVHAYKPDAEDTWKDLTRQILFDRPELGCQVRFFDVAPGGHTTLERHQHGHAVIVLAGRGTCLVGNEVVALGPQDLVETGPWEWHQFRAAADEHLGFVCIVNRQRDRPQLPTPAQLEELASDPDVAAFLGRGR